MKYLNSNTSKDVRKMTVEINGTEIVATKFLKEEQPMWIVNGFTAPEEMNVQLEELFTDNNK